MLILCVDGRIVIRAGDIGNAQAVEKAYMKQFDGATIKFVSSVDGDKLVIDIVQTDTR